MRRHTLLATALILTIAFLLSACGPSEEEKNATATAEAAAEFATQTAEAPTLTPTPTNTPLPTDTPTPAPTETPMPTPEMEDGTADPLAALEGALPAVEDMPPGFQELPPGLMDFALGEGIEDQLGAAAMYMNMVTNEFAITTLTPLGADFQRSIFEQQLEDPSALAGLLGSGFQASGAGEAEVEYEVLELGEGFGERSTGVSASIALEGATFIYDMVLFVQDDVGAMVGVLHAAASEPEVDVLDLAGLVDGRLSQLDG